MHPHAPIRKLLKSCSTEQIHHGLRAVTPAIAATLLDGIQLREGALVLNKTFSSGRRALPWRTYAVLHLLALAGEAAAETRAALTTVRLEWQHPTADPLDLSPLLHLPALRSLSLHNAAEVSTLPGLSLTSLAVSGATKLEMPAILTPRLRRLNLSDMAIVPSCLPAELSALRLTGCTGLSDLRSLPALVELSLRACPDLDALPLPETLESLHLHECPGLTALTLTAMPLLRSLVVPGVALSGRTGSRVLRELDCLTHTELAVVSSPSLEHVHMAQLSGADLGALAGCTALRSLKLDSATDLVDLTALSDCTALEELTIAKGAFTTTQPLAALPRLRDLTLRDARALRAVDGLGSLSLLTDLDLSGSALDSVDGLEGSPALTHLRLSGCRGLDQIHALMNIPTLQEVLLPSSNGRWSTRYVDAEVTELQSRLRKEAQAYASMHVGDPMVIRLRRLLMHDDVYHQRQALEVMRSFGPEYSAGVLSGCQLRSDGTVDIPFGQVSESLMVAMIDAELVPGEQRHLSMGASLLASLAFVRKLPQLQTLTLSGCQQLSTLSGLEHATNLQELVLEVCPELSDISALRGLRDLRRLVITSTGSGRGTLLAPIKAPMLEDSLRGLVRLEELRIDRCSPVPLAVIAALPHLKILNVPALSPGQGFARLGGQSALEDIELQETREIEDLNALRHLTGLRRLVLGSSDRLRDLRPLAHLTTLTELIIGGERITDLSPLSGLTGLTVMGLNEARGVTELSALSNLSQLRELVISGARQLKEVRTLRGLSRLEQLGLQDLPSLETLDGLEECAGLKRLELVACSGLLCADALVGMAQLTTLEVDSLSAVAPGLSRMHHGTPFEIWTCRNHVYSELQHRIRVVRRDLSAAVQSGDESAVMAELDLLASLQSEAIRNALLQDIDKEKGQWGVLSAAPLPHRERALARLRSLLD